MRASSRLARLLQALAAIQLAAILAWLAWRWPQAPAQALLGVLAILSIAPAVLATEFVLLAIVSRRHPGVPLPSARQLVSAWAGESWHLFLVFYWRLPFRWRVPEDKLDAGTAGRRGVVFIHGFVCNRGFWAPWLEQVRAGGHACVAVNLEPVFASIDHYVPIVEEAVRKVAAATGGPPILVCHSMGGLAARAWLRSARDAQRVAAVITIATPHRGTWLGRFSRLPNGRQMRLDGDWLRQLERDEERLERPPWTCWYSNCDNIVFPVATATLAGADNRRLDGVAHVALAFAPEVMQSSLAALTASAVALSR